MWIIRFYLRLRLKHLFMILKVKIFTMVQMQMRISHLMWQTNLTQPNGPITLHLKQRQLYHCQQQRQVNLTIRLPEPMMLVVMGQLQIVQSCWWVQLLLNIKLLRWRVFLIHLNKMLMMRIIIIAIRQVNGIVQIRFHNQPSYLQILSAQTYQILVLLDNTIILLDLQPYLTGQA